MIYHELFSNSGLSLDRLKSFLEVVDTGSIVQAAQGDANKQSLYSRQIKELETFFGASLTERKGRRITITEEGHRLAKLIRHAFTDLADFQCDSQNEPKRASFAAGASVMEWLIAPAFAACRQALGHSLITTHTLRTADVIRGIDDGNIDFGIIRSDFPTPSLESISLGKTSYRLFIPRALAPDRNPRSETSWDALLSQLPQARIIEGGTLRRLVDEAHQTLAIRPHIVAETTSLIQLAALVKAGHCAAILPQMACHGFQKEEAIALPLTGFLDYERKFNLIYKPSAIERRGWSQQQISTMAKKLRPRN